MSLAKSNTYTKKNSGFLGISLLGEGTSSTATQINNFVGSSAQAGANLLMASGGSATLVGSQVTAGGQAVLAYGVGPAAKAGASLNLDAAINSTLTQSSSTNNGLVVSTKVADTFTQSLTYNQFSPNIAFVGAGPINVDYQGALVNETQNSKAPQMPKGFGSWVGTQGIGTNGASGAACPAGVTCTTTTFTPAQIATALGAANDNLAYLAALNNNPAALVNTSAAIAQAQAALQQLGVTIDPTTLTPGGSGVNWNALTLTNQSATWETKSLNPIAMIVVNAILHMVMGPAADMLSAVMQAAVISAIDSGINGAISGKLDAGQALENAAIAALEAAAFSQVHVIKNDLGIPQTQDIFSPNFDPVAALESASLHALVGCGGGALSGATNGESVGGGCASGAAAAGIGDLAGNIQTGSQLGQFLITSLAGGLGAKLGGGDFATGAFQAGLGYFYNDLLKISGLPIKPGNKVVPVFDAQFADQVMGFVQTLQDMGINVKLTSGFRDDTVQAGLAGNQFGGAQPGNSLHEAGFAFDINYQDLSASQKNTILQVANEYGLLWGGLFNKPDPIHFYVDPFGNLAARQAAIIAAQQEYLQMKLGGK